MKIGLLRKLMKGRKIEELNRMQSKKTTQTDKKGIDGEKSEQRRERSEYFMEREKKEGEQLIENDKKGSK